MTRRHVFSVLLSIVIVAGVGFGQYMRFHPRGANLPLRLLDNHTVEVDAVPDQPLPPGIQVGDRLDMQQQDLATRIAWPAGALPLGQVVSLVVQRGPETLRVPVTVVDQRERLGPAWQVWTPTLVQVLLGAIALLLIWRGRDRAATGMGIWATAFLLSAALTRVPLMGWPSVAVLCLGILSFLVARVGFYSMVEARVGGALSPTQRLGFRISFWVLLAGGAVYALGGPLLVVSFAWAGLTNTTYGLVLTASYLVPVAMLFVGYRRAAVADRQRLRWMLMSGSSWFLGILLQNTPVFGAAVSNALSDMLMAIALLGFLYAVLWLRVVDISVVVDRALVYGGVTTLVVGILAAVNSLALREVLTPGASLVVQVVIPLALGIVLGKVRGYMDRIVERVFFRKKYLAEKALKAFARRAGHMQDAPSLLEAAADEVRRHTGAPAVAIYSLEHKTSRRVRQAGEAVFPERLKTDDAALVALRADRKAVDLGSIVSSLGEDGCAFPMVVLGNLRGFMVCGNRPGEHFPADERKLLSQVAREVGAAWRILRAQDNEAYVAQMAKGKLSLKTARDKARSLSLAWTGAGEHSAT